MTDSYNLSTQDVPRAESELVLVVFGRGAVTRYALAREGTMLIGRGEDAAIRIREPWISREHARLHVGASLSLEDLGSANGTRVRHRPLRGGRAPLAVGDTFELGATLAVVARGAHQSVESPVVDESAFDARLDALCAHEQHRAIGFVALALRVIDPSGAAQVRDVGRAICDVVQANDSLSVDTEGVYWLVVTRGRASDVPQIASRLGHALASQGLELHAGAAHFPREAGDRSRLKELARRRLVAFRSGTPIARPIAMSEPMHRVRALAALFSSGGAPVVVSGERGVGKRVVAEWLHTLGPRVSDPLVRVDAVACNPSLIAHTERGTLLLSGADRIDASVLRATVRAVEAQGARCVFTATSGDARKVATFAGGFGASVIAVPPLRERLLDIEPLAQELVARAAESAGRAAPRLSLATANALREYGWPGNVEELALAMFSALGACGDGDEITPEHIGPVIAQRGARSLHGAVEQIERARIADALAMHGGNQVRASRTLGIARNTLIARMRQFGITPPRH